MTVEKAIHNDKLRRSQETRPLGCRIVIVLERYKKAEIISEVDVVVFRVTPSTHCRSETPNQELPLLLLPGLTHLI